jgi:hypothetical protein
MATEWIMETFDGKQAFQALIKEHVAPWMKANAFEQKGIQTFRRFVGETIQYLSFQAWRGGDTRGYDFTINLMLVAQTPANTSEEGRKEWYPDEGILMVERVGRLTHGRDKWYSLEAGNAAALAAELMSDLCAKVMPALDRLTSVNAALEFKRLVAGGK